MTEEALTFTASDAYR